jgi:hypothetical protein
VTQDVDSIGADWGLQEVIGGELDISEYFGFELI